MGDSAEYRCLVSNITQIESAIQSDVVPLCAALVASQLISSGAYEHIISLPTIARAGKLISFILERVKMEPQSYHVILLRYSSEHDVIQRSLYETYQALVTKERIL
jgi:hypothetical protein